MTHLDLKVVDCPCCSLRKKYKNTCRGWRPDGHGTFGEFRLTLRKSFVHLVPRLLSHTKIFAEIPISDDWKILHREDYDTGSLVVRKEGK